MPVEESKELGKAAIFNGVGKPFSFANFPIPRDDEGLLVNITMATICGSDIHRVRGFGKTAVPAIIGHESTGRVYSLPRDVQQDYSGNRIKAGDRIVYPYFKYCGRCRACLNREIMMVECENRLGLSGGISCEEPPHFNGAFAEYLYLRPGMPFFKVPDELSDEVITPLNCALSAVYHGVVKLGGVRHGDSVVIQGAGALGVYAAALTKKMGASKVIVIDKIEERLKFIEEFGADRTVNLEEFSSTDSLVEAIFGLTERKGADVAIEVSGSPTAFADGVKMLRKGGRYLEMGSITQEARSQVDIFLIALRELQIVGNMNYDAWVIPKALEFLKQTQDTYPYEKIISHKYPLEQINEAFNVATQRHCIRVALIP
jgi:threonine dehydrogenase-like Zn-dependent dehydrogenase